MKTIINKQQKQRRLADGTILEIGANLVSDEVAAALPQVAYQADLLRKGFLRIENTPEETEDPEVGAYVENLAKVKIVRALALVAACDDVAQLKAWLATDGRKRVRDAIIARGLDVGGYNEPEAEGEAAE